MQGSSQGGKTKNEGAEVCYHAEELLKLCDVSWCGQDMYSINLLWIWMDSRFIIEASKEFHHWGLDMFSWGWTLNHTSWQFPWSSIDGHYVQLLYNLDCELISNPNATFTIFQYFDPSSSGKHPGSRLGLYTGALMRDLTVETMLNGTDQCSTDHKGSIQIVSCHHCKGNTMPHNHYAYIHSCLVSASHHITLKKALCTCQLVTVQDHIHH